MKILLSSRGLFSLSFLILFVTNIVVLSGVASNRSGESESQITLTERELQLPYRVHEENSGLSLRLTWRALGKVNESNNYSDWRSPVWFGAEKLKELGFNINDYLGLNGSTDFYKPPIPKEVFVVLENDGEPYKEAVRRAEVALKKEESLFKLSPGDKRLLTNFERAKNRLEQERKTKTRLFVIDAGLDAKTLREKYSDRTRFVITKGLVNRRYITTRKEEVFGYIKRLSVASIHVPLKYRKTFDAIQVQKRSKGNEFRSIRYEVELIYGKRLEPWVESIKHLDDIS